MIQSLLKDKIEDSIQSNNSLREYLNYSNFDYKLIIEELNDYILSKGDIYKFENFKNLFYENIINNFTPNRFGNFIRKVMTYSPDKERTYKHILNDIEDKLKESYNFDKKYLKMSRQELDDICNNLLLREEYSTLFSIRKFVKENFKICDYNSHVYENRDLALKVLKTVKQDKDDATFIRLSHLLKDNTGYLGLFTYFNKIEKIPFARLKTLYKNIISNKDILNLLPENAVDYMRHRIPYTPANSNRTYDSHFERLTDDLTKIKEIHNAKLFADKYPQKFRSGLIKNSDFIECIKELVNDKDKLKAYNTFFIKKIARYKTKEELLDALIKFVFVGDNDEILDVINSNEYLDLVYEDSGIIVIRVRDYDDLKEIASDTSWCIKDSLSYWMDYVKYETIQLAILLTDEKGASLYNKIGVTLNRGDYGYEFYTAHLKNDRYILFAICIFKNKV